MSTYATFMLLNVTDTCALWNILGSSLLSRAARRAAVSFSSTQFVYYECFYKRGENRPERQELQSRLRELIKSKEIGFWDIDLEDLQELAALEERKAISKGELSSIVFAKRTAQSFLSDDVQAKKLARAVLAGSAIQDTPHLCAWLCIHDAIHESDEHTIRAELATLNRALEPHLHNAFLKALEYKLMKQMESQTSEHESGT
jgi:hypothetical protein